MAGPIGKTRPARASATTNLCRTCRFASYGTQLLRTISKELSLRCAFSNREIVHLAGCTRHEREPGSDDDLE